MRLGGCAAILTLLLGVPQAAAAQWGSVDDHRELQGKRVVDVGALRVRSAPVRRTDTAGLPTLSSDTSWIEFEGVERRCLGRYALMRVPSFSDVAALLLEDARGLTYLATLRSDIGDVRVDVTVPHWIRCPSEGRAVGPPP